MKMKEVKIEERPSDYIEYIKNNIGDERYRNLIRDEKGGQAYKK